MLPIERCLAALRWGNPDRVPVVPQNCVMSIQMSGYDMNECLYSPHKLASAMLEAQEKMNYDGVIIGPDAALLAEVLGCEVSCRENDPPGVVGHLIENPEDVDKLRPVDLTKSERVMTWLEATRIIKEKRPDLFVVCRADQGAFSLATLLRGSEDFMLDLAMEEDVERIHKLLAYCNDAHIRLAKLTKAYGADATTCGDAYCGPGLISPDMYRTYALPYQQKAVMEIQQKEEIPYSIHICGKTDPIHSDWKTTGATLFEVDHCTDLSALRAHTLNRTAILGNLNTSTLCFGTTNEVQAACRELIEKMMPHSGYFLSSGCSMSGNTSVENVLAMVEAAHTWGCFTNH